eukprot:3174814-Rhodomonas_salina.3
MDAWMHEWNEGGSTNNPKKKKKTGKKSKWLTGAPRGRSGTRASMRLWLRRRTASAVRFSRPVIGRRDRTEGWRQRLHEPEP